MIDNIQQAFIKYNFISSENIRKLGVGLHEKLEVDSSTALLPLSRCKICTLL